MGATSRAFSNQRGEHKHDTKGRLKGNFIATTRLNNSSPSKTKLFKVSFDEFNEVFNVQYMEEKYQLQQIWLCSVVTIHSKFFFHKPEGFVARGVYDQKTR